MTLTLLAGALAVLAGFATQRGSICAVLAAREAVEHGRWARFRGFLECSAWVALLLLGAAALGHAAFPPESTKALGPLTLLGAALFGLGAVVNNACAFGSIARLGGGDLAFLALPPGFLLGAAAARPLLGADAGWTAPGLLDWPPAAALVTAALLAFAAGRLWSVRRLLAAPRRAWAVVRGDAWPAPFAMAVIAAADGPLLLIVAAWPYTAVLVDLATGTGAAVAERGLLAALFLLGAVLGALAARRLRLVRPAPGRLARCLLGGTLMGAGAALIPGGNDSLVLHDLPALTLHALAAYAAMALTILAAVRVGGRSRRAP